MLGLGASRQWFVPPSEHPSTKGQPCETKVAAPAAPAVPRFVFFSHLPAGDLAGCRGLSRRLMRLKEAPGGKGEAPVLVPFNLTGRGKQASALPGC